jgi:hypothetical protein
MGGMRLDFDVENQNGKPKWYTTWAVNKDVKVR